MQIKIHLLRKKIQIKIHLKIHLIRKIQVKKIRLLFKNKF
jgi:hypothetical protein